MAKTRQRIIETSEGIQGEFDVAMYNVMQRSLRDKGWIETNSIMASGIKSGLALEIGPGPGYLGLEWLKKTRDTTLKCVEISDNMIQMAEKNAREYGFQNRIEYKKGMAEKIPYSNNLFDAVFSNGSLHEWPDPVKVFNEIYRVLKNGGRYFVSDMKRNLNPLIAWFLKVNTKPREIRPGLISSINASYTRAEMIDLLNATRLRNATVAENMIGIEIKGLK